MKVIKYEIMDSITRKLGSWVSDCKVKVSPEGMLELLNIIFDTIEQEEEENDQ